MEEILNISELRLKSVTASGRKDSLPSPTAAEMAGIIRKSDKYRKQTYHEALQQNWHAHILEMGEYTQRNLATNPMISAYPSSSLEESSLSTTIIEKEFETRLAQLKKDLIGLILHEIKELISTLRDEMRNLYQEVENDRSLFVKRQKEYVQHQFEWFKTDLKDGWRKEAEKKHEEFCDHVQQAISQQLREFQKYVLHAQQSDLQLFKTQIISKLEKDFKESKTHLQKELNQRIDSLQYSMLQKQHEYESDELNAVKIRLDSLEEALTKEKQEKEEIERDFKRLQKEFQQFLEHHPSQKFHPDYMLLEKSHIKLSDQCSDSNSEPKSRFLSHNKQDTQN